MRPSGEAFLRNLGNFNESEEVAKTKIAQKAGGEILKSGQETLSVPFAAGEPSLARITRRACASASLAKWASQAEDYALQDRGCQKRRAKKS